MVDYRQLARMMQLPEEHAIEAVRMSEGYACPAVMVIVTGPGMVDHESGLSPLWIERFTEETPANIRERASRRRERACGPR